MAAITNLQSQGEYLQMDLKMTQGDTLLTRWMCFPGVEDVPVELSQLSIKFGIRQFPDSVTYTSSSMPIDCECNSLAQTINGVVYAPNTLFRIRLDYTETGQNKLPIPDLAVQARYFYDVEILDYIDVKTTFIKGELLVTKQIVKT